MENQYLRQPFKPKIQKLLRYEGDESLLQDPFLLGGLRIPDSSKVLEH
jgi:hypothetical protein